jgi:hypothetical protein
MKETTEDVIWIAVCLLIFAGIFAGIYMIAAPAKLQLRPHNNGDCIENHCLGDKVIIKANGKTGYLSDYYKWKPSVPTRWTVKYSNDVGTVCTEVFKPFELTFIKTNKK